MYPWGGMYTRNNEGCFLANFKPLRGNYSDDGGVTTLPVGSYEPNEFGLSDMAGNVAEWTSSAYDESAYTFTHDLNPDYKYNALPDDPPVLKRKVIRGGSWKDIGYYLQTGVRSYEYQDTAKSYIGFRCVRTYLGGNSN
jgi:sulfatase modifying factor 1